MKWRKTIRTITLALLVFASFATVSGMQAAKGSDDTSQWKAVEGAMGRPGKAQPDGTFKFSMPRKDLKVTVKGTAIKAGLALGSWLAFEGAQDHAMVMGDLVLTDDEIQPVMLKLQQGGIQQTALHNHLLYENPRVMYMHIEGHGDAVTLAKALHDALALTKTPPAAGSNAPAEEKNIGIDTAAIENTLGHKGKVNGGIFQVSVPRSEKIVDEGIPVPPSMGTATSINFQPTGNGRAAITGDFVLVADEVNPVLKALRDNGIEVTALHSHMLNDQPHLFFMHYWANDDANKLARGLRAALDKMKSAGGAQGGK